MELTTCQKLALPSVKWLLNNNTEGERATGRTTLMAVAFIEVAKENLGRPIQLFDHYAHPEMSIIPRVMELLNNDYKHYIYRFNKAHYTLTITAITGNWSS